MNDHPATTHPNDDRPADLPLIEEGAIFRCIVDGVPGCIFVADANGQIIYANKFAVALLGRPLKELLGSGWFQSLHPNSIEKAHSQWEQCIQRSEPLDATWLFRQHDGNYRWQHLRAEPTNLANAQSISWYVLGVDVDEQVKAQESLRASEQEAREILDRVPAMISIRNEEGIAYTNKRLSDYVGAVITDLRDGSYLDYTHPDDRERIAQEHIHAPEKAPNDIIYRLRGKDGIYRWFHTRAEPYFNKDGSVYRWYALNSDIDDLYRSKALIQEREFQLNLLVETAPAILWKASSDGSLVYVNGKCVQFTGRSLEELKRGWNDLIHPEDIKEVLDRWHNLLAGRDGQETVHRLLGKDGQYRWFHSSIVAVRDDNGKAIAFHGVMLDTTERKNAEVALQKSEEHFRKMMDAVPTLLWSFGPAGENIYVNKSARDHTGITIEEVQNEGWARLIHPDDRQLVMGNVQRALRTGRAYAHEYRLFCAKDGKYRWFFGGGEPLRDEDGRIVHWYGSGVDVDAWKQAEVKLRDLRAKLSHASRVATVAELAASIAHELNQPLTSVLANAQACSRWLSSTPPNLPEALSSIERILRDGRAAATRMRSIRSLFKLQPSEKTSVNMVELIREAVSIIQEDVNKRHIPIEFDFEEAVLMVSVDRIQIQQVIINLVANAIEAMDTIGREPQLRILSRRAENDAILTEFVDNGRGLNDTEEIFDAFMTTKNDGMGIGLAISRSIVDAHEGQLWATNNTDHGATFSLLLRSV